VTFIPRQSAQAAGTAGKNSLPHDSYSMKEFMQSFAKKRQPCH
jgi:hypothetical protein